VAGWFGSEHQQLFQRSHLIVENSCVHGGIIPVRLDDESEADDDGKVQRALSAYPSHAPF